MFLNESTQVFINGLRGYDSNMDAYKASICDAMSVIMFMYQNHASPEEREMLANAIDTLSIYNTLLTELSKEK